MDSSLSGSPNLNQLEEQTRELFQALKSHDPEALSRVRSHCPDYDDAPGSTPTLSQAEHVVAREHGFANWRDFRVHLDAQFPNPVKEFRDAVYAGSASRVRALFRSHPSLREQVDAPLFGFDSPAVCIAKHNPELMDALLQNGADINARSRWWAGSFGVLDNVGTETAVSLIALGAYVDANAASSLGIMERLMELLAGSPNLVNARGGDGQTPLHVAQTAEIAAFLLDHGAELETRDIDHGSTPAQYAAADRPDVCRLLLARGARGDIFMQCALGEVEAVKALLESNSALVHATIDRGPHDPDPAPGQHIYHYTFCTGATPLIAAAKCDQRAVAELLLTRGADVNAQNGGATALHLAAWEGHTDMLRLLLGHGADRNRLDKNYRSTAAGWAAHNNRSAAKDLLLEDAGIVDAARFGLSDRIRDLLVAPENSSPEDISAALDAAVESGQDEIAALLRLRSAV